MTIVIKLQDGDVLDSLPIEYYKALMRVGARHAIDPQSSVAMERFFVRLISNFTGSVGEFENFINQHIITKFKAVANPPKWMQNPAWPCDKSGEPMVFIGQIILEKNAGIFHDDASFYLFYSFSGETETIIQVL